VVPSENPESLSEKIIQVFSDKKQLEEIGKYARYLSESKYSWKSSAELMKSNYENLIKNQ
jgi:glycosyltransferase involved in cell wall biosynthesis